MFCPLDFTDRCFTGFIVMEFYSLVSLDFCLCVLAVKGCYEILGRGRSVIIVIVVRRDVIELSKVMWIFRRILSMCVGANVCLLQEYGGYYIILVS